MGTIGASIIPYAILGLPCYSSSIFYPQNPVTVLTIEASIVYFNLPNNLSNG